MVIFFIYFIHVVIFFIYFIQVVIFSFGSFISVFACLQVFIYVDSLFIMWLVPLFVSLFVKLYVWLFFLCGY